MIVVCENCGAEFSIRNDKIAKSGRFLRCGLCEHEWLLMPGENIMAHPQYMYKTSIISNNFNKTNRSSTTHHLHSYNILSLCKIKKFFLACFVILCLVIILEPSLISYIKSKNFGVDSHKDVIISDLSKKMLYKIDSLSENSKNILLLNFKVINQSKQAISLQRTKIVVRNKNSKGIGYFRVRPKYTISSGNLYAIEAYIEVSEEPDNIIVTLYNESGTLISQEISCQTN